MTIRPHLTGRDTSNEVRCMMLDARGGREQETGSGSGMSLGLLTPANSVTIYRTLARTTEWDN